MSRLERVGHIIQAEVSNILLRKLSDRGLGFISITSVSVSPDLRNAKIFYSQIGSEADRQKTAKTLEKVKSFIRFELGKVLKTKVTPKLTFAYDASLERGVDLVNKINKLK